MCRFAAKQLYSLQFCVFNCSYLELQIQYVQWVRVWSGKMIEVTEV